MLSIRPDGISISPSAMPCAVCAMAFLPLAILYCGGADHFIGKRQISKPALAAPGPVGLEHTTSALPDLLRRMPAFVNAPLMGKAPSRVAEKIFQSASETSYRRADSGDDDDFFVIHKKNHLKYGQDKKR